MPMEVLCKVTEHIMLHTCSRDNNKQIKGSYACKQEGWAQFPGTDEGGRGALTSRHSNRTGRWSTLHEHSLYR
jgi:hypothetical protein